MAKSAIDALSQWFAVQNVITIKQQNNLSQIAKRFIGNKPQRTIVEMRRYDNISTYVCMCVCF